MARTRVPVAAVSRARLVLLLLLLLMMMMMMMLCARYPQVS
jgi:hypothetical protein